MLDENIETTYRLLIYHRFYKKGNLIHYDSITKTYHNHSLAVFKDSPLWSFTREYILTNTQIFEPYGR